MSSKTFHLSLKVPQSAIDDLGHVNNIIYLQWTQKISRKHWESAVPHEIRKNYFWIVLNHYIEYKNPAFKDDVLVLTTRVEKMEGVRSERHVEIKRKKDNKILAEAKTVWCLVDAENQRPARITAEMIKPFFD